MAKIAKVLPGLGALLSGGAAYAGSDQDTEVGKLAEGAGAGLGSFGGAAAGAAAGALAGSFVPIVGNIAGGIIGGILGGIGGDIAGKSLGGGIADFFGFADGGIVRQPTLAMVGEGQSDEAVIPLQNNRTVPVDIDMSGINKLAENVGRMADRQNASSYNDEMLYEMKKFNRNTDVLIKKLS